MNALNLLTSILTIIGPDLKKAMVNGLQQWKTQAATTSTPVDDLACNIMLFLLGA